MYRKWILLVFICYLLISCSSSKEAFMPFRNMAYSGQSLLPVQKNNADWILRVWINNGTSVDRIITVSDDSLFKKQGKLLEIGFLDKKSLFSTKEKYFFKENDVSPKSGFKEFMLKIETLKLEDYTDQENFDILLDHEPFSLYVVEFKKDGKYNQFVFRTYFPLEDFSNDDKFKSLEKLLFDEFKIDFYLK
ncbi:hypothetical protein [Paenimyroides marinum]|nr:hypothetical protein [Paenimyroides aquimaris]